jgi:O-antigen/teichoic acid export membrane protein
MMLSRHAGLAHIPVYDIAFRGSMQLRAVAESGLRAAMPEVSRIGANMGEHAREQIASLNRRLLKLILFGAGSLFGLLFVTAGVLLRIWLRERFVDVLPWAFRIMLVASFVSLLGVPAFYTHMGQGRVRHCLISHAIISIINVVVVVASAAVSPETVERRVYYAILLGQCASTGYLIWQLRRSNRTAQNQANVVSIVHENQSLIDKNT